MFPVFKKKRSPLKKEGFPLSPNQQQKSQSQSPEKKDFFADSTEEAKEQTEDDWVVIHNDQQSENSLSSILNDVNLQELGILQDINIFSLLQLDKIHLLWRLWELALTNQPLLIISDSPTLCRYQSLPLSPHNTMH